MAEAVPVARGFAGPGDLLVARKPQLAYYTGARFVLMPDLESAGALRAWLCTLEPKGRVLVYAGQIERAFRPALQPALTARTPPPWLERIAAGAGWTLHRLRDPACAPGTP